MKESRVTSGFRSKAQSGLKKQAYLPKSTAEWKEDTTLCRRKCDSRNVNIYK